MSITEHIIDGQLHGLASCNQPHALRGGQLREQQVIVIVPDRWPCESGDFLRSRRHCAHYVPEGLAGTRPVQKGTKRLCSEARRFTLNSDIFSGRLLVPKG
jgi:hypothetical protein